MVTTRILKSYPDYGKAPPEYALAFTEALSYLSNEELAWVSHPHTGINTVCAYLPTVADIHKLIAQRRETANKSYRMPPPQGAHAYFEPEKETPQEVRQAEIERRKAHVMKVLGYDPSRPRERVRPTPTEATAEDLENLKLKTPPGLITPQLRALLAEQGWFQPHKQENAA